MKGNGGGLRPSEIQTAGDKKCYLQLLGTPARSLSIISTGRSYAPLPRAIGIIIRDNNSGINRRRGHSCRKFSKHRLQDIRTSFCQYTLCQFLANVQLNLGAFRSSNPSILNTSSILFYSYYRGRARIKMLIIKMVKQI